MIREMMKAIALAVCLFSGTAASARDYPVLGMVTGKVLFETCLDAAPMWRVSTP
jgi:hypothetical protein